MTKTKTKQPLSDEQQRMLEVGKQLNMFVETGYYKKRKMFFFSFLQGIARGIGTVVGATIVIALLIWILSLFSQVPFIGNFTDKVQSTINSAQQ